MSDFIDSFFGTKPPGMPCAAARQVKLESYAHAHACYMDSGYTFSWLKPSGSNDYALICKSAACKGLLDLARSVDPTEHSQSDHPRVRPPSDADTRAFDQRVGDATAAPAKTGETPLTNDWTTAPMASSSSDSGSHIRIWGIVGAVIFVIAAIVNCIRRSKKRKLQGQSEYLVAGHEDAAPTPTAAYVQAQGEGQRPTQPKPSAPPMPMTHEQPKASAPTRSTPGASTASTSFDLSRLPLMLDEQIIAVRVPFEKVQFGVRISCDGFGGVYKGTYKGETVAIKQLLPEYHRNDKAMTKFLAETKLMSSFEHERIVSFVGVAWDKVSDMCVLSEFMEGGDLRSLLSRYEAENRPEGFDRPKLQIALHVAHALTYMHSLQPIVLHRDLKSSNILLSQDMDAKVTDFGVSRTLAEATMTRGVGTSLWMAPEIMMGGRYDEKGDIFSFGVVLSELDSNKLPYASHVDSKTNYGDLMQRVAHGRLTVDFSYESDPEIVALGRDCVAFDPHDRPTAAEALHRIHQVLQRVDEFA